MIICRLPAQVIRFEVGQTYSMSSPCDHNCIWTYRVVKRTAKTVTLQSTDSADKVKVCRPYIYDGSESCLPLGSYSMAPVLCASRPDKPAEPINQTEMTLKSEYCKTCGLRFYCECECSKSECECSKSE